jgi:hypothetical protein
VTAFAVVRLNRVATRFATQERRKNTRNHNRLY